MMTSGVKISLIKCPSSRKLHKSIFYEGTSVIWQTHVCKYVTTVISTKCLLQSDRQAILD